jgi:ribosomal-protein-alanine N-acetyltransferase
VQPAAFDPQVAHVRLVDDGIVPGHDEVRAWIELLLGSSGTGVRRVRTAALFPAAARPFLDAGFHVVDTLALLRVELAHADPPLRGPRHAGGGPSLGDLGRRDWDPAAHVDQAAFGREWGHDASELRAVRTATPHAVARRATDGRGWRSRRLVGFAISGASHQHGYLQRLAVDPAARRRGIGRALTLDALAWMSRRRLVDCLVNTSVTNDAALALYRSVGFTTLTDHLVVLERHAELPAAEPGGDRVH